MFFSVAENGFLDSTDVNEVRALIQFLTLLCERQVARARFSFQKVVCSGFDMLGLSEVLSVGCSM